MYAPGQFYLQALLFRVFGSHLLVNVVAASVLCSAAASACYWLVLNLIGRRKAALVCAVIFLAATYRTGYFKHLGSYQPAIFLILVSFTLMVLYYRSENLTKLFAAGLATGAVAIFKHDVGGYTAIAIIAGLLVHQLLKPVMTPFQRRPLVLKLAVYSAGITVIASPVLIYFAIFAGPDMLRDLIIFPLTDFRFARPEGYPSLLPFWIYDKSPLMMSYKFLKYVIFTLPFLLFLSGLVAIRMAARQGRMNYVAASVMLSVGYLLHYSAAHVQINTHIITMSVYAACLGAIFYDLAAVDLFSRRPILTNYFVTALALGWILSLAAFPVYKTWKKWRTLTAELQLARISGFRASPQEAKTLENLVDFVDSNVPQSEELFVGVHRHDVVVVGDTLIYFILDRPIASRYQELHPAWTDTAPIQQEIIEDLQAKKVSVIILKRIFTEDELNRTKKDFLKNLPNIGATDLDDFIQDNYVKVQKFGPYTIWKKKGAAMQITEAYFKSSRGGTKK
jgi:4-amino-4-deoxy-L-arabinose transferase-like glycosyltransferase